MPAARTGSIARNAMSQAPFCTASNTLPAASKVTNSIGTARRLASSHASSDETPRGSPVVGSFCASTLLPKLIAARSLPLGASSVTTLRGTVSAMASDTGNERRDDRKASAASALIMEGSSDATHSGRLSELARIARLVGAHVHLRASARETVDGE